MKQRRVASRDNVTVDPKDAFAYARAFPNAMRYDLFGGQSIIDLGYSRSLRYEAGMGVIVSVDPRDELPPHYFTVAFPVFVVLDSASRRRADLANYV
jgi:hypothetical protein